MIDRRRFLLAALAASLPLRVGAEPRAWRRYRNVLAIDACGGFGRFPGNEDGSLSAEELADARESGLSAVVLTLAPSGRFRFNDAAFETTVKAIGSWEQKIAQHPQSFIAIRTGADLERARRERKVGLI